MVEIKDITDPTKWKKYVFRFRGGEVGSGQPLAAILGRLGVNVKAVAADMNKLAVKTDKSIKNEILFYLNMETKKYEIKMGTPSVTTLICRALKISKLPGNDQSKIPISKAVFNSIVDQICTLKPQINIESAKSILKGQFKSMRLYVEQ